MSDWNYRRVLKRRIAWRSRRDMATALRATVANWPDVTLADCCNELVVKSDAPGWVAIAATVGLLAELERRQRERRSPRALLRAAWTAIVRRGPHP
jgi:hypothetical protein